MKEQRVFSRHLFEKVISIVDITGYIFSTKNLIKFLCGIEESVGPNEVNRDRIDRRAIKN